jgi:hypothetical protein
VCPDDQEFLQLTFVLFIGPLREAHHRSTSSHPVQRRILLNNEAVRLSLNEYSETVSGLLRFVQVFDVQQRQYREVVPQDLLPTAPSLEGDRRRDQRPEPQVPEDLLWADEHVVIVFPWATVHLTTDGQVHNVVPMSSRQIAGLSADGRHVWLAPYEGFRPSHVYDLVERQFVVGWPEQLVGRAFCAGPEDSGTSLVDFQRARAIRFPAGRMLEPGMPSSPLGKVQYSPGGDLAWPCVTLSSELVGVVDLVSARPIARLAPDGASLVKPRQTAVSGTRCRALVRKGDSIRLFLRGRIIDNGKDVARVRVPRGSCVAFARSGNGLAFATRNRLELLELDEQGRALSTRTLDLRPLHQHLALAWDRQFGLASSATIPGLEPEGATMHDVMRAFGTVEAVRNASAEELVDRVTSRFREDSREFPQWDLESARLLLARLENLPSSHGLSLAATGRRAS